ncbi:Phosphoglycerate kinase [uncultured Desulfatiglans sp.]|nr:Phosphoglycerate kinase [uncultured Desulfatiglans sp.]
MHAALLESGFLGRNGWTISRHFFIISGNIREIKNLTNEGGQVMRTGKLDPGLRILQNAEMDGKAVLLRVDHNVVKAGEIKDPYRIDATFPTLYAIAARGGRPILMTHVGRPKDKKSGKIVCRQGEAVDAIAKYLEQKLAVRIHVPEFPIDPDRGILHLDRARVAPAVKDLKHGRFDMIYLPNSRWFAGEQAKGKERESFAQEMASIADLYVNDAFGSWRPHASTFDIAAELPSFAGILLQREISNLHRALEPEKPFVAVVAGSKYDTKIGPIKALYDRVDHLILGGLIYNTFLAAKYGVRIAGVADEDIALARELVEMDSGQGRIVEMPFLVEVDTMDEKGREGARKVSMADLAKGGTFGYLVDVHPDSLAHSETVQAIDSAMTVFVNAVMGYMPLYPEGTRALYELIGRNKRSQKLFAGGDTLQELRSLCPGVYLSGLNDPDTYYFTGGGTVLTAIEMGGAYRLEPVSALMG